MMELLSVEDLACIRCNREIFSDISFVLPAGGLLILRGANGSGKSSLLRILATLLEPADGTMRWRQQDTRLCREEYVSALSYVGHKDGVRNGLTVRENLQMNHCLLAGESSVSFPAVLQHIGLEAVADISAGALSAGQRRRLALARLMLAEAPLWLLDEPLSTLDEEGVDWINGMISRHCRGGGGVVMALHDERAPVDIPVQSVCL